jgi:hypothetical protein
MAQVSRLAASLLASALMFTAGTAYANAHHSAPAGCIMHGQHIKSGQYMGMPDSSSVRMYVCVSGSLVPVQVGNARPSAPKPCPAPALAGPHGEPYAGYVASGSRIVGTNGGNGIAPGDVFTCVNGYSGVN